MSDKNLFSETTDIKEEPKEAPPEYLKPHKTFGIAVCGDVMLNKLEVEIVNTLLFQRLRKIKQLGSTYLVYPSAVHTRFEHSLGVVKMADLIITRIRENKHSDPIEKKIPYNEEQIIRLIALLHDIGHMPFGHTIEDEFGIFESHDKHESRWEFYLGKDSEIGKIIIKHQDVEFHALFFKLIKCEKNFDGLEDYAYMYDIVSNTVCADLLDYLNRDCSYTNLKLKYHPRFLDYFFIKPVQNKESKKYEKRIAIRIHKKGKKEIRNDVISELIELLRYRYYLGERVYYHHTKINTGTMLAGAVLRAKEAKCFELLSPTTDLINLHTMGDEQLLLYLQNLPKKGKSLRALELIHGAEELIKSLERRSIFSELIYKTKDDLGIDDEFDVKPIKEGWNDQVRNKFALKLHDRLIKKGSEIGRLEIEDDICKYLPDMKSGDFLIYCPAFNMAMKLAKMKVVNGNNDAFELMNFPDRTINNECKSIADKHQHLWALRVFVNKKFVEKTHEEYKKEYSHYKNLIEQYCDWQIFSNDVADEKAKGEVFWDSYIRFKLAFIENSTVMQKHTQRDEHIEELAKDFAAQTQLDRTAEKIINTIKKKFNIE